MKFDIVVMDPPYGFSDRLTMSNVRRGAEANYKTMSNEDLLSLPIKEIASEGALLALWVPSSLLPFGLQLMSAYGFEMKQTYIWIKVKKNPLKELSEYLEQEISSLDIKDIIVNFSAKYWFNQLLQFNMGRLFRACHEICLIGTNSNKIYKQLENKSQRSVCFAPNLKHSAKPEVLQDSLDIMFKNANKIELFARRVRPGWYCFGNQIKNTYGELGEDIRVSLAKLIQDAA